jgi:hypothetical protein
MKRTTIPARPDHADRKKRFTHAVDIVLGDEIENDYEVTEKDFTVDLPDSWTDPDDHKEKKIRWISNFGLKKPDGKFEGRLPKGLKYRIELPGGLGKLVYFDGQRVQKLVGQLRGNKFEAELDLGDPPVGESTMD